MDQQDSRKNWLVRAYDDQDEVIDAWAIENRTEPEAENEAIADLPPSVDDWTMVALDDEEMLWYINYLGAKGGVQMPPLEIETAQGKLRVRIKAATAPVPEPLALLLIRCRAELGTICEIALGQPNQIETKGA